MHCSMEISAIKCNSQRISFHILIPFTSGNCKWWLVLAIKVTLKNILLVFYLCSFSQHFLYRNLHLKLYYIIFYFFSILETIYNREKVLNKVFSFLKRCFALPTFSYFLLLLILQSEFGCYLEHMKAKGRKDFYLLPCDSNLEYWF